MKKLILVGFLGVFFAAMYFLDVDAWAADKNVAKADDKQAAAAIPTEEEFLKVIKDKCIRCHPKAAASMDTLKQFKWIVPGKPESSPVYKVIGKNKKPKGTYHNLTDAEKKLVYDFIKSMK
ncbi:MAG TPA: hypothetical protein DCZ94_11865 [Lentisphaeria bacterium]|nr:MAG: hypothetical protein A2X48_09535 [Lentisphaerae bacterium GWF2_49_21]HBC87644.1 hypothetical protein [Lentisphaeria bacterium]